MKHRIRNKELGIREASTKLQEAAKKALEIHNTPPQRYGTAFHVRPPVADVRELHAPLRGAESPHFAKASQGRGSISQRVWDTLIQEDKKRILSVDFSDVYLTWHLAHLDYVHTRLIHVSEGASQSLTLSAPRGLAFANASAWRGKPPAASSQLYWIVLEPGAHLAIEDGFLDCDIALRRMVVWQKSGSSLSFVGVRADTAFLNEFVQIHLLGSGAEVAVTHCVGGRGKQQMDIGVTVYHRAPHTASTMNMRSAVCDKAVAVYRGRIDMDSQARASKGYQAGRSLLLSPRSVSDMLPELEIKCDDVQCSHGVTTTHLDEQVLFYLRSRGLSSHQAQALALQGFYNSGLALSPSIRRMLETYGESIHQA